MTIPDLTRDQILSVLKAALEPLAYTNAMWEAGAAAFNRVDQWSDIDLMVDVDDEHVADTFTVIDQTLAALSPIELRYEIPQPTWHGHSQVFYRLTRAGPYQLLDIAVMKHSSTNKFLEVELHGHAVVHFDKTGVIQPPPLDREALQARLQDRLGTLQTIFDLFQVLTLKEIQRGNEIEAIAFYHGFTLRPLVEALRIRYQPDRYNYHTRYIHYDLPANAVQKLRDLYYVRDVQDLLAKREQAEAWFYRTIKVAQTS